MRFTPTPLPGAFLIDIEPIEDERGFFARTLCEEEFSRNGLNPRFIQQSVSWNPHPGTLRGLHYQAVPHEEEKLVRATRGAVFDVIVDLRQDSPTFRRWFGTELSADNRRQIYIPCGMAHGFQTLVPDTEMSYAMTAPFHRDAARGLRWDDPSLGVQWPHCGNRLISDKDRALPLLQELK